MRFVKLAEEFLRLCVVGDVQFGEREIRGQIAEGFLEAVGGFVVA